MNDTYVLIQCMLDSNYWHMVISTDGSYGGRLPYEEAMHDIKLFCSVRDKCADILVISGLGERRVEFFDPDVY